MRHRHPRAKPAAGFSLIEVLLGIALIGTAMLGLAQLFMLSVFNNHRADQIISGTFLAQQQVDYLRTLTAAELMTLEANYVDETLDLNNDGTADYRRITQVSQPQQATWAARVLVFPAAMATVEAQELFNNPRQYRAMSDMNSIICR
jgi:prepilin-type N-terminal cleavage/methylation domain-containing protein